MRLVECENPQRVYNKYLGEYIWVPCQHCETCKKKYRNRWIARLENERKSSLFTLFVTLTYDDAHLPRLKRADFYKDGEMVEAYADLHDSFLIPFHDLVFAEQSDLDYFNDKMSNGGVPFADFSDIQKFCKRFNKFIHDKYTFKYENFRYFIVSELGKCTLRPHYHCLFFFREAYQTSSIETDIYSCWRLGNIECEAVEANAASYVSKYIGKPSFYPSFYGNSKIRPKFVCSKQPPIGSIYQLSSSPSEIFHGAVTHLFVPSNNSQEISSVPMPSYCKSRLFPKCPRFASISHSLRVAVYGCAGKFIASGFQTDTQPKSSECLGFNDWLNHVMFWTEEIQDDSSNIISYLREIADNFSEKGINSLRRLYFLSKRVLKHCEQFYCGLEYYVLQIEKFFDKLEIETLGYFYGFQRDYVEKHSLNEIENMYSEFAFNNQCPNFPDVRFRDVQYDYLPLSECVDYKDMCLDSMIHAQTSVFSHLKNALKDSLKCVDLRSKNLTLKFYYAKKCNEIIEAIA